MELVVNWTGLSLISWYYKECAEFSIGHRYGKPHEENAKKTAVVSRYRLRNSLKRKV